MWPPGNAHTNQTASKRTDHRVAPAGLLAMTKNKGRDSRLPVIPRSPATWESVTPSLRPPPPPRQRQRSARTEARPPQPPPRSGTEPAPYRPTESPQRTPPVTVPPPTPGGGIPKEGPQLPAFGRFKGGTGGKFAIPPKSFFGGLGMYSFDSKRIHPQLPQVITCSPSPPERRVIPAPIPGPSRRTSPAPPSPPERRDTPGPGLGLQASDLHRNHPPPPPGRGQRSSGPSGPAK